jgi:hypothetical protein
LDRHHRGILRGHFSVPAVTVATSVAAGLCVAFSQAECRSLRKPRVSTLRSVAGRCDRQPKCAGHFAASRDALILGR